MKSPVAAPDRCSREPITRYCFETLERWRGVFNLQTAELRSLGYNYCARARLGLYLAQCEAAFRTRLAISR